MSRRIAHRPRYHHMAHMVRPSSSMRKVFFRTRWSYRRPHLSPQRPGLGQGLLLVPVYRFVHTAIIREVRDDWHLSAN